MISRPTAAAHPAPTWTIDRRRVQAAARRYGPAQSLLGILWRQLATERRVRRNGQDFRQSDNAAACAAYVAMDDADFVHVNARQAWANWRTIPRSLDGRLPARPVAGIDLCCGVGDSTAVLAWCCPPGSRVHGLEISADFVARARRRAYHDHDGRAATVTFGVQSVLEPWRDEDGAVFAESSLDLVNASGAVGCHFDRAACRTLVAECARVLRPGGIATIDAGPSGTDATTLHRLFADAGFRLEARHRSCPLDQYRQLCLRRR